MSFDVNKLCLCLMFVIEVYVIVLMLMIDERTAGNGDMLVGSRHTDGVTMEV